MTAARAFQFYPEHTIRIEGNAKPVGPVRWVFEPLVVRIEGNRAPRRRASRDGGAS